MAKPPAELLEKAKRLLNEEYDPEEDSFLLIFTKKGKTPSTQDKSQTVVGEMPLQPTVFFLLNTIQSIAKFVNEHPYVYIVRRILAPFISMENSQIEAAKLQHDAHTAAAGKIESGEDTDFGDGVSLFDADMSIEN